MMNAMKRFWKDESAQGATEYILLLVAVVAIAVLFRGQITKQIQALLQNLSGSFDAFSSSGPN
ncbi:MAG: Flp1 family type IVb pilin [Bdellovibrionales bacterium]